MLMTSIVSIFLPRSSVHLYIFSNKVSLFSEFVNKLYIKPISLLFLTVLKILDISGLVFFPKSKLRIIQFFSCIYLNNSVSFRLCLLFNSLKGITVLCFMTSDSLWIPLFIHVSQYNGMPCMLIDGLFHIAMCLGSLIS